MSGDLEPRRADGWVAMVAPVADLAGQLAQTSFAGAMRGKPADIFACVMYGRELGLSPLQALQLINVVQGRPSLGAEGLRALYLQQGHRIWPVEWDDRRCTVHAERGDGRGSVDVTYTMKEATDAGLLKNPAWRSYPRQMLLARATSMAIRAIAPDVALGLDSVDAPMPVQGQEAANERRTIQLAAPAPEPGPLAVEAAPEPQQQQPQQEADSPPDDGLITAAQRKKLGAQIRELEAFDGQRLDRDERRAMIAALAGADNLRSANDLTREQASRAIDALDAILAAEPRDQPQEES